MNRSQKNDTQCRCFVFLLFKWAYKSGPMYVRNIPHKTSKETAPGIATKPPAARHIQRTPQFLSHGFPRHTGRCWWQRRTFLKRDEWVWWAACPESKQQCFFGFQFPKSGAWCIMDSDHARRDDFLNPGTFVAVAVGLLLGCCWIAQLG